MADPIAPNFLSKTEFVHGLFCPRLPWLERYRPEIQKPLAKEDLERMEVGRRIGSFARKRHPNGVYVDARGCDPEEAMRRAFALIAEGAECLFEATFVANNCKARVDILWRSAEGWVIDEVKSSSLKPIGDLVKSDKFQDLAFQMHVLRRAGLDVAAARLVLVDTSYVWRGGDFEPQAMLGAADLSEECREIQPEVERRASEFLKLLNAPQQPEAPIGTHCKKCGFSAHCLAGRPLDDILHLPKIYPKTVAQLHGLGCTSVSLIPSDFKLTAKQARYRDAVISRAPVLGDGLADELESIRFPAAFIDYETSGPAFPAIPGTRPYQHICFQWSAHILGSPDAEPTHFEFLHDPRESGPDPRPAFCESLYAVTRNCASIVHYTDFEIGQLRPMAAADVPCAKEMLAAIEERSVDLHRIVDDHVCFPEFSGRTSIKVVLPVLVPGLSYADLPVSNGNEAGAAYRESLDANVSPARRAELRDALLRYCRQDTLAMVEIYRALRRLVQG